MSQTTLVSSYSGAEMDPHTARLLDDLKQLLREKVITLAQWREEVAAIHERALAARPVPVAVAAPANDSIRRDDSVD